MFSDSNAMQSVDLADPRNHAHFEDSIPIPKEDSIVLTVSTVDGYLKKAPSTATPAVSPQSLFVLSRGNGTSWRGSTPDGRHSLQSRQFVYSAPVVVRGFKNENEMLSSTEHQQEVDDRNRSEETNQEKERGKDEDEEIKNNHQNNHQNSINNADSEEKEEKEVGKNNNLVQHSAIDKFAPYSSETNEKDNKDIELLSIKNQLPVLKMHNPPSELGIELTTNAFRFCLIVMVVILFTWIKQCYT